MSHSFGFQLMNVNFRLVGFNCDLIGDTLKNANYCDQ